MDPVKKFSRYVDEAIKADGVLVFRSRYVADSFSDMLRSAFMHLGLDSGALCFRVLSCDTGYVVYWPGGTTLIRYCDVSDLF